MKTESLIHELEALCEHAGYRIRKERGAFRGDSCVMEGDMLIIVNKNRPVDVQVMVLAKVLQQIDIEEFYVKPAVRKKLLELWDRISPDSKEEITESSQQG
ncbi:MAG: hypothetical protein WEC12_06575 [Balneolaceae bacterium]